VIMDYIPKFSRISLERLETCEYELRMLFSVVIEVIDCTILCGRREKAEQNKLFEAGHSRCKWPHSSHNVLLPAFSSAIDVAPYYIEKPHVRWDKKSLWRWYFFGGIVLGIASEMGISIRWGGDWDRDTYVKDQKFNDLPHFELIL